MTIAVHADAKPQAKVNYGWVTFGAVTAPFFAPAVWLTVLLGPSNESASTIVAVVAAISGAGCAALYVAGMLLLYRLLKRYAPTA